MQIASLFVVNLQTHVSWAWGYAVPTIAFGVALLLFFAGTRLYKFVPPGGSALWRMLQVSFLSHDSCRHPAILWDSRFSIARRMLLAACSQMQVSPEEVHKTRPCKLWRRDCARCRWLLRPA